MYNLFTFHSTHSALMVERLLKDNKLAVKLIPVPRAISSSCGLAARTVKAEHGQILDIINHNDVEYDGIYEMGENGEIL